MEGLAPPLQCLLDVRASIESGKSVRTSLLAYISSRKGSFATLLGHWLATIEHKRDPKAILDSTGSLYRRSLLEIFELGLNGHPILQKLIEFEEELVAACEEEIQRDLDLLPFKLLCPLLFCQFPAFLLLLLGPIFVQLLQELSQ